MSRAHSIYNVENVFVGPSPNTGYHFIDMFGNLNNSVTTGLSGNYNINLVQLINRIQNISYEINPSRADIQQLGTRGLVSRPIIDYPTINLSFDYYQMGVVNEYRLGLNVNFQQQSKTASGTPYYANNFANSIIGGLIERSLSREDNELHWPYYYKDKKNIFVAVSKEGIDQNKNLLNREEIDLNYANYGVYTFGNCYLTSYSTSAAVQTLPRAGVSFLCENLVVYSTSSGQSIPAVNYDRTQLTGMKFAIPYDYQSGNLISSLHTTDIRLSLQSLPKISGMYVFARTGVTGGLYPDVYDLGLDINDMKIQGYNIKMNLNREPLRGIGFALPIDRRITFPVFVDVSFDVIVGDGQTGSFLHLVNQNDDYNINIKMLTPFGTNPTGIAIQYDVLRAKFNGISYRMGIGNHKVASYSFTTEIDPSNFNRGFFVSGLYGVPPLNLNGFLLLEGGVDDGSYILQEDGVSKIFWQDLVFY